jgi:hypothetical protein
MHQPHQPLGVISERRHRAPDQTSRSAAATRQRQPVSSEQSWILWTISWLGSAILEGFALYGQSIYPCVIDLPQDYRAPAEEAERPAVTPSPLRQDPWLLPRRPSHDIDIPACLATASWHSPQTIQRRFRLAAVLPRRRTEGSTRSSCKRLGMPNDRSLRDDGVDPDDVGLVPQQFDPVR